MHGSFREYMNYAPGFLLSTIPILPRFERSMPKHLPAGLTENGAFQERPNAHNLRAPYCKEERNLLPEETDTLKPVKAQR